MYARARYILTAFLLVFFAVSAACAQQNAPVRGRTLFAQQELDQMLAPIALYPDSLLSQILMASTYPREVVEAARWSRRNPGLNGDRAVRAVGEADWDPSVKSLVAFPQILGMLDEKLDWTEDLGDAFLDQEASIRRRKSWITANAPAPAVAAQPEARSAPVRANTAESTPHDVPGRSPGAREHDRPAFEGRGESGPRPEARFEPGIRQAQRDSSQAVIASTHARSLPERAPVPVVARDPVPRSAPAPANVQAAANHPAVEQRPAVASAASRAEARPAAGRERAHNSTTAPADGGNPRHP